ncbi:hypothetical protein KTO58_16135 [Chitinophaga pendula]|uniref:hypothetical protein n=1 Tax=Chitinophaga TaxID=79328 RepID=UPI000BAF5D47|nr:MULTISPECIES: hypothetical protein [Chitinophaga]ASZ11759.1 hypothetical protein CK934_12715 [Chitinophaga sp. MD30]UCJ05222.1 hypothetical protein KTO58_16135 [Chitinophaga pendula]
MYKYYIIFSLSLLAISHPIKAQNKLEATGHAGIGTTSPREKLEVANSGAAYILISNSNDVLAPAGGIRFDMAGTETGRIESERVAAAGRASALKFNVRSETSLKEGMRIDQNGMVGIGTTVPEAGLHVSSVSLTTGIRLAAVLGNSWDDWTAFGGTTGGRIRGSNEGYLVLESNKNGSNNMIGLNLGSPGNVLMVTGGGNVGIGTAKPKEKLTVDGKILAKSIRVSLKPEDWPDYVFAATF